LTVPIAQPPPGAPPNDVSYNAWDATPHALDNAYWQSLLKFRWGNTQPDGPGKTLWAGPGNQNIMLNGDMSLGYNIDLTNNNVGVLNQQCGPLLSNTGAVLPVAQACVAPNDLPPSPSTLTLAQAYANSNQQFLTAFSSAFAKLITLGYGVPANVDGSTSTGRLGTLTSYVDFPQNQCDVPAPTFSPTIRPSSPVQLF